MLDITDIAWRSFTHGLREHSGVYQDLRRAIRLSLAHNLIYEIPKYASEPLSSSPPHHPHIRAKLYRGPNTSLCRPSRAPKFCRFRPGMVCHKPLHPGETVCKSPPRYLCPLARLGQCIFIILCARARQAILNLRALSPSSSHTIIRVGGNSARDMFWVPSPAGPWTTARVNTDEVDVVQLQVFYILTSLQYLEAFANLTNVRYMINIGTRFPEYLYIIPPQHARSL